MNFSLVQERIKNDAAEYVAECEAKYIGKVQAAAKRIAEHVEACPIILLSGPSGSGKTTTSYKLEHELEKLGIGSYAVSLDNYFNDFDKEKAPKTEKGEVDYESPFCLDLELLGEQIGGFYRGEEVCTPRFNFTTQRREEKRIPLKRRDNEVVIIEGIHALNDMITKYAGSHGVKIYVSAREIFYEDDDVVFKGTWTRLVRRIVRDEIFRSTKADFTLGIWGTIREGEKKYISPFKNRADIVINSTHGYEIGLLKKYAYPLLERIPEGVARYRELCEIAPALARFNEVDEALVPKDSLLREFIGGGKFNY